MKTKTLTILMISILIAGMTGILAGRTVFADDAHEETAAAASGEEKHAEEGEGHTEEGVIEIDEARIKAVGIELAQVSGGSLGTEILAQAVIAAAPEGQAVLSARADGSISAIRKRLGDHVERGEIVAVIESREAAAFAADRSAAAARANAARATHAREKRLFASRITARQDLEAAQAELGAAEAELRRASAAAQGAGVAADGRSLSVTSPISGRITASSALLGSYVSAGAELFRVSAPGAVQVEASLSPDDAKRIVSGGQAILEMGGAEIPALVRSVTPAVDPESRSITVLLTPTQETAQLQPGQSGRARIRAAGGTTSRLVIPEAAIQNVEGRDVVFVRDEHGFKATPVTVSSRSAGRAEILDGLQNGAVIAATNSFLLKAELQKSEAGHDH